MFTLKITLKTSKYFIYCEYENKLIILIYNLKNKISVNIETKTIHSWNVIYYYFNFIIIKNIYLIIIYLYNMRQVHT